MKIVALSISSHEQTQLNLVCCFLILLVLSISAGSVFPDYLDYASTTWEDINALDKVQHRGARSVCNSYTDRTLGCVIAMLNSLGWIPLTTRQHHQRLIMLYKIQHCQVEKGQLNLLRPSDSRRGTYRLYQIPAVQSVYKFSFFLRTIEDWNSLPTVVIDCTSLEGLKL